MKRLISVACIAIYSAFPQVTLGAQSLPAVAAYGVDSSQVGDYVGQTVNDLIFSFILELRSYRITDLRTQKPPEDLTVPEGKDYIFHGTLTNQPNGVRLELTLRGGRQDVTRKISRVYENTNRVLLESRMLVRDLFDQNLTLPDPIGSGPAASAPEAALPLPSLDSLSGTWSGEAGVEKILILRGGKGVMILSSGVSLSLSLDYQEGLLVVTQKGALNPRQFLDLPEPVARQAAATLTPWEWDFNVDSSGKRLTGRKKTTSVTHDGTAILKTSPEEVPVEWQR